jgi:phosphate transport system substrate-binding protein
MKYNRIFLFVIVTFFLYSCNNKKEEYSTDAPNRGEITIQFDDSFSNVVEALTYRYMKFYPETKIIK